MRFPERSGLGQDSPAQVCCVGELFGVADLEATLRLAAALPSLLFLSESRCGSAVAAQPGVKTSQQGESLLYGQGAWASPCRPLALNGARGRVSGGGVEAHDLCCDSVRDPEGFGQVQAFDSNLDLEVWALLGRDAR